MQDSADEEAAEARPLYGAREAVYRQSCQDRWLMGLQRTVAAPRRGMYSGPGILSWCKIAEKLSKSCLTNGGGVDVRLDSFSDEDHDFARYIENEDASFVRPYLSCCTQASAPDIVSQPENRKLFATSDYRAYTHQGPA